MAWGWRRDIIDFRGGSRVIRVETTFFLVPQFLKIFRLCIIMLLVLIYSGISNIGIDLFTNSERVDF